MPDDELELEELELELLEELELELLEELELLDDELLLLPPPELFGSGTTLLPCEVSREITPY